MSKLLYLVHPRSPGRQPHWRWLLSRAPRRHGSLRFADRWVRRARLWALRKRHQSRLRRAILRLRLKRNRIVRWYIEAGILAGMSLGLLARQCHLPVEVVEGYAALFFDIECRRHCTDWIRNCVIGLSDSPYGNELGVAWKWWGYTGGQQVLDLIVQSSLPVEGRSRIQFDGSWSLVALLIARLAVGYLTLPKTAQGGLNRVLRRIQSLRPRHHDEQSHTEWWFSLVHGMDLQRFSSRVLSLDRKNHSDRLEGDVGEGEIVDNQESDGGPCLGVLPPVVRRKGE